MKKKPIKRKSSIPKDAVVVYHLVHDDAYDLPPHIDFDYSKAKPNPYAGRIKYTRGGERKGAGRKPAPEPVERHTITLYKSHTKYLRSLDANLSRAIRKLIARARP